MNKLSKDAAIGTLGLPLGDHWVKFHVEGDSVSFEIASSLPAHEGGSPDRQPSGFVKRWAGTARKCEDKADPWLSHINDKHLR